MQRCTFVWTGLINYRPHALFKVTCVVSVSLVWLAATTGTAFATPFVFVSVPNAFRIDKFDMNGGLVGSIDTSLSVDTTAYNPYGLAIDSAGNLYASSIGGKIVKYDSDGNFLADIGSPSNLSFAYFLAVDSADRLYASNFGTGSVSVFDSMSGSLLNTVTGLSQPYGIALDAADNLYVANFGTDNIAIFDDSGSPVSSFALPAGYNPTGLAIDGSGQIYVADYFSKTVRVFDGIGTPSATIGTGTIDNPWGMAFDYASNLYVVNQPDVPPGFVSKYGPSPSYTYDPLFDPSGLSGPYGIAIAVPEPSTVVLLVGAAGVAGFASLRRRCGRRRHEE